MTDPLHRKIIHVDMDAFFASVEQLDNPELRGKPIAVGGGGRRGVVAAASYEARKYGVRSAMPSVTAKRLCPELIFVRHNFDRYKEISRQIREIFTRYTDLVEPLSLDEAYLDVTENKLGIRSATLIASQIRQAIREETGLTASAGVSINKFLAKVASDINKPDGLALIPPEKAEAFLEALAIERFFGIGKKTAEKMKRIGIHKGADLKRFSELELASRFGKAGRHFYRIVRAQDSRGVKPDRVLKSVSAENTYSEDLTTEEEMLEKLDPLVRRVAERLSKSEVKGRTVTIKIKYNDFLQTTRSKTLGHYTRDRLEIWDRVEELIRTPELPVKPVRLLGVGMSNLDTELPSEGLQLTLEF